MTVATIVLMMAAASSAWAQTMLSESPMESSRLTEMCVGKATSTSTEQGLTRLRYLPAFSRRSLAQ